MNKLERIYKELFNYYGHLKWWPAHNPFEVIVGAILTQNCSWHNVEIAINNLKKEKLLNAKKLYSLDILILENNIKPSGYYRQKAKKLKIFLEYFKSYNFSIEKMMEKDTKLLREEILSLWGVGEETADSILCYALDKPSLVVDTYTRRMFFRLNETVEDIKYIELKKYIESKIPKDNEYYKDFHAQIVKHSVNFCKKTPVCDGCILKIKKLCSYKQN